MDDDDGLAPEFTPPPPGTPWFMVTGRAPGPCGARTRSGTTCAQPGVGMGGRCRYHGGCSTGPTSPEGKRRSALNGLLTRARREKDEMQLPTWTPLGARLESHLSGKRPWGLVDKLVRKVERADEPLSRDELQAAMGAVPVGALVDLLIRRRVLVERVEARRLVLISRRRQ